MSLPYYIEPFDPAWTLPKLALVDAQSSTASSGSPRSAYSSDKLLLGPADRPFSRRKPPTRLPSARTVERTACGLVSAAFLFLVLSRETEYVTWRGVTALLSRASTVAAAPRKNNILKFDTPQPTFRENLRDDLSYLTTFPYAGLTNQLLSTFKLIYMAGRLGREAILPDLEPNHGEGEYARYSDFFDLDYLSTQTKVGLAEWRELKSTDSTTSPVSIARHERLGCWGEVHGTHEPLVRYDTETSFWPVPPALRTTFGVEPTTTYAGIEAVMAYDSNVTAWLDSRISQWFETVDRAPPLPNRHLACFDNLFYTSAANLSSYKFVEGEKGATVEVEGLERDSPVWLEVGQHLRFTPRVERLVDGVLERLIGDAHSPFIAMHLRQGDFLDLGRATNESSEIKTKYSAGLDALRDRLAHLAALEGVEDVARLPVLLATDSTDETLLAELRRMNWTVIDHDELGTRSRHGGWYPGLLDSAILSRAVGLVGTKRSTFTYLAERRIETWNGGAAVIVEL
ncbi:hypothetical protein JCM11491_005078 [Sporobolomyces phaffii]